MVIGLGCSDEGHGPHDGNSHDVHNASDTAETSSLPTDEYVAGLDKESVSGLYKIELILSDPIPKYTDVYTWSLRLLDMEDNPVEDALIVAEPTMPDHKHGTYPKFTTATAMETFGQYQLGEMDLFMPGVWQIDIRITVGDGPEDQVLYWFALEG
jgi:hypothetical protein